MSKSKHFSRALLVTAIGSLLTACGSDTHQDLEGFVNKTKQQAQQTTSIEPLPDIKPYETYLYKVGTKRDPFTPTLVIDEATEAATGDGIHPDPNRRKEALESFPLDSLRMVGTLQRDDQLWAIVKVINNPDSGIHRVVTGNYMGQNHGQIVRISEEKIELVEIIPNGLGGWRESETSIALSEE
jgi:type IV pilus assembly protein PilP